MKVIVIILLLLSGAVFAHTVTLNFVARVGNDVAADSIRANNTNYNLTTPISTNYSNITNGYVAINKSSTMATVISTGNLLTTALNNSYYHKIEDSDTVMMLHLDNSTRDSGPYENNATAQNDVDCSPSVTGKLNTACNFDGLNDYINSTILTSLEGQSYTISLWINTLSNNVGIFSQAGGAAHRIELYLLNGQPNFFTFEGGSAVLTYSTAINDGQWHHIGVTKSGTTGRLYVDGLLRDTNTIATITSTDELIIGNRADKSNSFGGKIDEVLVYNRTLSTGEVHDLALFDPRYILAGMKQDSDHNRFLIGFTNGTYTDIDNQIESIHVKRIISSTLGRFFVTAPENFPIFIRLEYPDIDLQNPLKWSGIGKLILVNRGNTDRNIPNITMELIR